MRIKTLQFRMLTRVIIVLLLGVAEKMNAYDISSVCSTGHTLYFNVLEDANCCVELTFPGSSTTHAWDGYEKPSGNVVLPSSIEYNGVFYTIRAIGNSAFRDCSDLLTVSIGNTIVSIEQSAFKGCINLTTVMMNSSVNSIGPNAFQDCNNLASLFIPESVTTIGSRAFYNCSSLYSLSIPDEVNQIGTQAFIGTGWYYNQLDGILYLDNWCLGYKGDGPTGPLELLQGTIGIADYAFSECNGISGELSFPSSIMSIGAGAFYKCNHCCPVKTDQKFFEIIEN